MFEEAEWTGERLLQVEFDEPLEKLGMYIETDRKYLLLQLSRVRDCNRVARRRLQREDPAWEQLAPPLRRWQVRVERQEILLQGLAFPPS